MNGLTPEKRKEFIIGEIRVGKDGTPYKFIGNDQWESIEAGEIRKGKDGLNYKYLGKNNWEQTDEYPFKFSSSIAPISSEYAREAEKTMRGLSFEPIVSPEEKGLIQKHGKWVKPTIDDKIRSTLTDFISGIGETLTLGAADVPRPYYQTEYGGVARGAGEFAGFILSPAKLGGKVIKLALKPVERLLVKQMGRFGGKIASDFLQKTLGLGTAMAISDIKDVKGMPERFKSGAVFGSIFGITGWANFQKLSPFLNQMIRQVGSRALAATKEAYQLPWENIEQWKTPEAAQRVFDELLFTWFSRKPIKPQELFKDLSRVKQELDRTEEYEQKLREMRITSARKPEEIKAWTEEKWQKKGRPERKIIAQQYAEKINKLRADLEKVKEPLERDRKLKELADLSARKPEEIETWTEMEWKKEPPRKILPQVWSIYDMPEAKTPEAQWVARNWPWQYRGGETIVTGAGEAIPAELFSWQPTKLTIDQVNKAVATLKPRLELLPHEKIKKPSLKEIGQKISPEKPLLEDMETRIIEDKNIPATAQYLPESNIIKVNPEEMKTLSGYKRYGNPADKVVLVHEKLHAYWDTMVPKEIKKPLLDTLKNIPKSERVDVRGYGGRETSIGERGIETLTVYKVNKGLLNKQEIAWSEQVLSRKKPISPIVETKPISEITPTEIIERARGREFTPEEKAVLEQRGLFQEKKLEPITKIEPLPKGHPDRLTPEEIRRLDEIDKIFSGPNITEGLKELDRWFESRYGEILDKPTSAKINEEIKTILRPLIEKELKEKSPMWGMKVINNLKRMGKAGNELADSAYNFQKNTSQHIQNDIFKLKQAIALAGWDIGKLKRMALPKKTSDLISEKLINLLEKKRMPQNEYESQALEIMQELIGEKATWSQELGLKIQTPFGEKDWQPLENYAPVEYDPKGLKRFLESPLFEHVHDRIIQKMIEKNPVYQDIAKIDPAKAREQAERDWAEIRNDLKTRPFGHLEKTRILDEETLKELEIEWRNLYPGEEFPLKRRYDLGVLTRYIVGSNQRLEWIRQFGKDVRHTEKGWWLPEKLEKVLPEFEKAESADWAKDFFKKYLRQTATYEPKTVQLLRLVRTFQLSKLTFAFIPNSLQWFTNTLPNTPIEAWPKMFLDVIKYSGALGPEAKAGAKEFFSKTGASILGRDLSLAMAEDPAKVAHIARTYLKVHGFTGTEFFNALVSGMGGARKAIVLSEKLARSKGKSWRSPYYIEELKKMGLSEADVENIIKEGPLTEKNVRQLADAAFYQRRLTQFLADAFDLPKSWSSPVGRVLTQFKNFAYNQTSLLYNEPIKEAYKFIKSAGHRGDIGKLVKAMITLPVAGALVTKFKKEVYPKLGITFYEELMAGKSWPMEALVYILNTGNLGLAADALLATRYGKGGITSLVGGPTVSDVLDISYNTFNSLKEVYTAIENKNLSWIGMRAKTIRDYWLSVAESLTPEAKIPINVFIKEYRQLKDASMWSRLVASAYKKYKELYVLKNPVIAEQFWQAFMETQGREYQEVFGKIPNKPTPKEVEQWLESQKKSKGERIQMPGTSKEQQPSYWRHLTR